jgi:GH15 family glucan-1,4-alpha-glucosidase
VGGPPQPPAEGEADRLLDHTVGYWRDWLRRSRCQGRYREMVERSALVLKLLVYQPTGALVAAPTTWLPEFVGGARNWDYRYTWIRDAAFTLYGLMRLGFTDEAAAFMTWLEARCGDAAADRGLPVSRGGRHRSTYSALMMWVAFERAIRIARQRGLPAPIARWRDIANCSYQAVQREGWSAERRAYVQYFGGATLDASLPAVASTILGARTAGQLETNLRAVGLHLSPAETAALNAASDPQPTDYPYGELGRQQRDRRLAGGG